MQILEEFILCPLYLTWIEICLHLSAFFISQSISLPSPKCLAIEVEPHVSQQVEVFQFFFPYMSYFPSRKNRLNIFFKSVCFILCELFLSYQMLLNKQHLFGLLIHSTFEIDDSYCICVVWVLPYFQSLSLFLVRILISCIFPQRQLYWFPSVQTHWWRFVTYIKEFQPPHV